MPPSSPARRALRRTVGAVGAGAAILVLGAAPAGAADPAPDVVLGDLANVEGVKPGGTFTAPVSFTNVGGAALDKVWLTYRITRGIEYAELPSNCERYEVPSYDEMLSRSFAVCEFDQTVEPGIVYAPETPVALRARAHALYDQLRVSVHTTYQGSPDPDAARPPVRGTGPAVKLVERPDATPAEPGSGGGEGWDRADAKVVTENTADFQVKGAQLKGRVGDTVPLRVDVTNAGPGWVLLDESVGVAPLRVTVPAGTTVTEYSGNCEKRAARTYECGSQGLGWMEEDAAWSYTFKVRIDKAVPGAEGSAAFSKTRPRPYDTVASNDTAVISLDVTGAGGGTGGAGGSSSSTGGSGSPGSSGSTGSTGGSGAASGSGGSTGGASTGGGTATDGAMADTGSGAALPLAAAAAGALVLGGGAVLASRRRAGRQR